MADIEKLKELLKPGDIILESVSRSYTGYWLQQLSELPYGHSMVVTAQTKTPLIHAATCGVTHSEVEILKDSRVTILRAKNDVSDQSLFNFSEACHEATGKRYNFLAVTIMLLILILFRIGLISGKFRKKFDMLPNNEYYCFSLTADLMESLDLIINNNDDFILCSDILSSGSLKIVYSDFTEEEINVQKQTLQRSW